MKDGATWRRQHRLSNRSVCGPDEGWDLEPSLESTFQGSFWVPLTPP